MPAATAAPKPATKRRSSSSARKARAGEPPARKAADARAARNARALERARAAHHAPARTAPVAPRRKSGPARTAPRPARNVAPAFARLAHGGAALVLDRVLRGRAWVAVIAVLLAGIVFLNVSVLELNRGIASTDEKSAALERTNSALRERVAKLDSAERIQRLAEARGYTLPAPGQITYLRPNPRVDGKLAAQRIESPSEASGVQPAGAQAAATPAPAAPTGAPAAAAQAAAPQTTSPQSTQPQAATPATAAPPAATTAAAAAAPAP
jgi:cell division protein FtsB